MANSISSAFRVLPGILLGMTLAASFPADAASVGAIPGRFTVTSTGTATYSIRFDLPHGINGLTPRLGLAYSSATGNVLAGYGWSLAGFSVITRCGKTLAADGKAGTITFGEEDRFCLDGNKLRQDSGTYGTDGATYRTEREQFSRITSYTSGGAGDAPGTGPEWFKVETRSGLTYQYGKTADSRIFTSGQDAVRVWALNKISDKNNNFILFEYSNDTANHSYRPSKVSYTGNGSITPAHTIVFGYESLPAGVDPIIRYVAGARVNQTRRLATVTVTVAQRPIMTRGSPTSKSESKSTMAPMVKISIRLRRQIPITAMES